MPDDILKQDITPGGEPVHPENPAPEIPPSGEQPEPVWTEALPESMRESAKAIGNLEGLEAALKRGMEYKPFASADEIKLPEPQDGEPSDMGWLKDLAVEKGLTQPMLDGLLEGYNAAQARCMSEMAAAAETSLKAEFGDKYKEKLAQAEDATKRLNEVTGGKLKEILDAGLGKHEGFVRAMIFVSEKISDSSLPGSVPGTGTVAMSTEDFFKEQFAQGAHN